MSEAPCWIRLCRLDELPPQGAFGFDLHGRGTDDFFIVRRGDLIRAYRNSCPHWPGSSMPWRKHAYLDNQAAFIVCSGHGARFTLDEGICIHGPCQGLSLEVIPLRLDEDNFLNVYA